MQFESPGGKTRGSRTATGDRLPTPSLDPGDWAGAGVPWGNLVFLSSSSWEPQLMSAAVKTARTSNLASGF
jgi:hypothetical protein